MSPAVGLLFNGWVIWVSFIVGLVFCFLPMPEHLEFARPLWLSLLVAYWTLYFPHRLSMLTAWLVGLFADVLYGSLLGQNALVLVQVNFLVLMLQQRLRMFPPWQQSMVLLVVFGLAQLLRLWLYVLSGNRPPPTVMFLVPALVSAALWPLVFMIMRGVTRWFRIY